MCFVYFTVRNEFFSNICIKPFPFGSDEMMCRSSREQNEFYGHILRRNHEISKVECNTYHPKWNDEQEIWWMTLNFDFDGSNGIGFNQNKPSCTWSQFSSSVPSEQSWTPSHCCAFKMQFLPSHWNSLSRHGTSSTFGKISLKISNLMLI